MFDMEVMGVALAGQWFWELWWTAVRLNAASLVDKDFVRLECEGRCVETCQWRGEALRRWEDRYRESLSHLYSLLAYCIVSSYCL
jgi:hypothetical protein